MWTFGAAPHDKKHVAIVASSVESHRPNGSSFSARPSEARWSKDGDLDALW